MEGKNKKCSRNQIWWIITTCLAQIQVFHWWFPLSFRVFLFHFVARWVLSTTSIMLELFHLHSDSIGYCVVCSKSQIPQHPLRENGGETQPFKAILRDWERLHLVLSQGITVECGNNPLIQPRLNSINYLAVIGMDWNSDKHSSGVSGWAWQCI